MTDYIIIALLAVLIVLVIVNLFKKSDEPTAYTMFPGTGDDKGLVLKTCINFTHPYWYARYYGLIEDCE